MSKYVVLDLETTGLETVENGPNPRATPLEIAAIAYDPNAGEAAPHGQIVSFVPHHDQRAMLETVEFGALATNRYFERRLFDAMDTPADTGRHIDALVELLDGATIVGSNPAYDAAILWPWLRERLPENKRGRAPWRFRLFDVEAATMTAHNLDAIPSLDRCATLWNVERPAGTPHSALGDAMTTCEVFDAIRQWSGLIGALESAAS